MFDTRDVGMVNLLVGGHVYEPDVWLALTTLVKPGTTFVDVGANVGIHTILSGRQLAGQGHVLSLEPNRNLFPLLLQNIRLNGLATLVKPIQKAAYDRVGKLQFSSDPMQHRVGALVVEGAQNYGADPYDVNVVTIDSLFPTLPQGRVVMKIDVEGREPGVVLGAQRLVREVVDVTLIFEYHRSVIASVGVNPEDFLSGLERQDLRLFRIDTAQRLFVPASAAELSKVNAHLNLLASRKAINTKGQVN
jgi:FkbM family methyltransferase